MLVSSPVVIEPPTIRRAPNHETSAVDTKTDALIRRAFAEEIPNTTKIIIAQRVSSVQEADQIVILDGGAVQAIGTHDELLADNRIYQEIYNQQNRKGGEE